MRASDIVLQLKDVIPTLTNRFTDELTIASIVVSGSGALVTTTVDHDVAVGDFVNVINVITPNPITSLTASGLIATVTTQNNHDLTEDRFGRCTINVSGADDAAYNGVHTLLTVPSRTTFTYQLDTVPALSPDTGAAQLLELFSRRGYNGSHVVVTVPSSTTFTYAIASFLPLISGLGGLVRLRHRITRSESSDSALATYSKQGLGKLWAYAVLDNNGASKNRNVESDAGQQITAGTDTRQNVIFNASIFVFFPAVGDIRAGLVRDLAQSEILVNIIGSMVGANLPTGLTEYVWGKVTYNGDNKAFYDGAIYAHEYIIEQTGDITFCDRVPTSLTVPFQQIDFNKLEEKKNILATGEVVL